MIEAHYPLPRKAPLFKAMTRAALEETKRLMKEAANRVKEGMENCIIIIFASISFMRNIAGPYQLVHAY